jgi:hypothetical protein
MQREKEYILLNCNPVNNKKGEKAVLYCYGTKPIYINKPHIFCAKRSPANDAQNLFAYLTQKFSSRSDVKVQKVPSGKFWVVQVIGQREIKRQLPDPFVKDHRCNVSQMLDWDLPPFSKIAVENGRLNVTGTATLEELLQLEVGALDWEADKNGTDEYCRLNTNSVASRKESFVRNIFDDGGYSQEELREKVERYIQGHNFPLLCSHNITYDALQPREKTGQFAIGVDGSSPVIRGITGYLKKIEVAGRQLFCSLAFAHNNLWCSNNKLETVANFLSFSYAKSLGYDELELLVQKAEKGDVIAKEKIKKYCLEDAQTHLKLAQRLLPVAIREALAFEVDINSACFNSKSALARKLRDKRYFEALHTYRPDRTLELQEFDVYVGKTRLLKNALNFEAERGYFTAPLIVVFPKFWKAFDKILVGEKAAAYLKQGIAKSSLPIDKIIFHRDLEALCEEPLFDLQRWQADHDEDSARRFYGRYGRVDPKDIERELDVFLKEFALLMNQAKVMPVNYSNRFFFLRPTQGQEFAMQALKNSNLIEVYGTTSKFLSGQGGRVLATINGTTITSELDIYGRKGLRTDFERCAYAKLLKFITGTETEAEFIKDLGQKFHDLAQGQISKVDLIYYTTAGLEPWEYSWPAQSHERIKALKALKAKKGERVAFGYGINSKGEQKRYRVDDFFRQDIKPDIKAYQQNFFGGKSKHGRNFSDGTISDLLYSIYPIMEYEKRTELSHFFEGRGGLQAKLN